MAYDLDTQRILNFNLTHTAGLDDLNEDFHFLDLAKMLSEVNRKSFRQGMSYDIASIVYHSSNSSETYIKACTAPNTWTTQAAWQLGFRHWMQQQKAAASQGAFDLGKWHDFKIYLNANHIGNADLPLFIDSEDHNAPIGDWDYSSFKVPQPGSADPTDGQIILMGTNSGAYPAYTKVSLCAELERLLVIPAEDPAIPTAAIETVYGLFAEESNDPETLAAVITDLTTENDFPPYSRVRVLGAWSAANDYPSDPWVARKACIQGGAHHMAAVGGFTVPCGLLCFETRNTSNDTIGVNVELVPGPYKGVSARPMRGGGT